MDPGFASQSPMGSPNPLSTPQSSTAPPWWGPLEALPEYGFKVIVTRPDGSREFLFMRRSIEHLREEFRQDPASVVAVDFFPVADQPEWERLFSRGLQG